MYSYDNPRPLVMIDNVVFGFDGVGLNVLLIQRQEEPFKGTWRLPEGYLLSDDSLETNAAHILSEETGLSDIYMEQFGVFSDSERVPSDRVLTIGFFTLVSRSDFRNPISVEGYRTAWFPIEEIPVELAYDTANLIEVARQTLKDRSHIAPVVFNLLDHKFSISELQRVIEVINGTDYDRRNFYHKVISTGLLNPEGMAAIRAAHRPPQLFSFRNDLYEDMLKEHPAMEYPFIF